MYVYTVTYGKYMLFPLRQITLQGVKSRSRKTMEASIFEANKK